MNWRERELVEEEGEEVLGSIERKDRLVEV